MSKRKVNSFKMLNDLLASTTDKKDFEPTKKIAKEPENKAKNLNDTNMTEEEKELLVEKCVEKFVENSNEEVIETAEIVSNEEETTEEATLETESVTTVQEEISAEKLEIIPEEVLADESIETEETKVETVEEVLEEILEEVTVEEYTPEEVSEATEIEETVELEEVEDVEEIETKEEFFATASQIMEHSAEKVKLFTEKIKESVGDGFDFKMERSNKGKIFKNKMKPAPVTAKDNILSREIAKKMNRLERIERFVADVDKKPELIFDLFKFFPDFGREFDEEIRCDIQDFLYSNIYVIKEFQNNNVIMEYNKDIFPSNVKVLYKSDNKHIENIPFLFINIKNREYKYLLTEEKFKYQTTIAKSEEERNKNLIASDTVLNIKRFISDNFDENTNKFKNQSLAKEEFFKYYHKDKEVSFFEKLKFNMSFKEKQTDYVDEILNIYDTANNNIKLLDAEIENCKAKLHCINEELPKIDEASATFIKLLLKHDYKIR